MSGQGQGWLDAAASWRQAGRDFVLVTVLGVRGSAPVEVGRRMLVAGDMQHGSVGGGRLEREVTRMAHQWLAGERTDSLLSLGLGAKLGQCCGGRVVVHFELVSASGAGFVVFGAGHVAQELVPILARLQRTVLCVDSREQWLLRLPGADGVRTCEEEHMADAVPDLPAASVCMVMTHRHDLDLEICRALLERGDMAYVGVIGSHSKGVRFRRRLRSWGLPAELLECPIGEQAGRQPAQVAIAIAARAAKVMDGHGTGKGATSREAQAIIESLVGGEGGMAG